MKIPREFEADVRDFVQMAERALHDPDDFRDIEEFLQDLLERLHDDRHRVFKAWLLFASGGVYHDTSVGVRAVNLLQSIAYYEEALTYLRKKDSPTLYSKIHAALALSYAQLPTDRISNLQKAIKLHKKALTALPRSEYPSDRADVQTYLGTIYHQLAEVDEPSSVPNLKLAIKCYEEALEIYFNVDDATFSDFAGALNNMGLAYTAISEDKDSNLEKGIFCFQEASKLWLQADEQIEYAGSLFNIGNAYLDLSTDDSGTNIKKAIESYETAINIEGFENFPLTLIESLTTKLGHICFEAGDWEKALHAHKMAISALDRRQSWARSEDERSSVAIRSWLLYDSAIRSAVMTKQYHMAIELCERSKTKRLTEQLWRRDIIPNGVQRTEWQRYQNYLNLIKEVENCMSEGRHPRTKTSKKSKLTQMSSSEINGNDLGALSSLRKSILEYESLFANVDPDYIPFAPLIEAVDINELAVTTNAVIVMFQVDREGTIVFLVGPKDKGVTSEQVLEISSFNAMSLWKDFFTTDNKNTSAGWPNTYYRYRKGELTSAEWMAYVDRTSGDLYERLLKPVHVRLNDRYPKIDRLILVPDSKLHMLPLHAAWWELTSGERSYLMDNYEIAYAPSCQVLRRCLARESIDSLPAKSLFAVKNPDGSLPYSNWEVETVSRHFSEEQRRILAGSEVTEEAVKREITFGEEKLFSTHGLLYLNEIEQSCLGLQGGERLSLLYVMALNLKGTKLVVMSACETGLSHPKDIIDREFLGLSTAFLIAGASTVVSSLWAVPDISTALLMVRFHSNLYKHLMSKAAALCEAQHWLRNLHVSEAKSLLLREQDHFRDTSASSERMASLLARAAKSLEELTEGSDSRIFSNPFWWGAFQCIGTGWPSKYET